MTSTTYPTRTAVDIAVGVLIAHRGCSEDAAFDELAAVSRERKVGLGRTARALISFVREHHDALPDSDLTAAALRWSHSTPYRGAFGTAA
ncbi:ANTAR domain-containing protein [Rhodococcus triatomae]|uniref:ANTAR domain-containing protein n=1 Tax=Rhodococcus triatomae TaxID=300028 RepID=A0A1G8MCD3_9NOCA|nr:ANTAR domain-containing protein [Rhodococcus triatomae]QNG18135.1 ANTAR domain-containing protein [Rhodococcus triatomae]QNG22195.1 ANTAR domain-containing protein [Rhodococcus triatomae]SDI65596.1 ANTAR domain-containing protein [Rhodococcus triatomae]